MVGVLVSDFCGWLATYVRHSLARNPMLSISSSQRRETTEVIDEKEIENATGSHNVKIKGKDQNKRESRFVVQQI